MPDLRRITGLLLWHAGFRPAPSRQEAEAQIALYPTRRRQVTATQRRPPLGQERRP